MRLSGKHVLVTGGTGMVGSRIVARLAAAGAAVTTLSRRGPRVETPSGVQSRTGDVTDPDSLDLSGFDAVVHGAAFVAFGLPKAKREILWRTNVDGTRNVLEAAAKAGVDRVLHVSSVAAIGATGGAPRDEAWVGERPEQYHSEYERSKHAAHKLALARDDVDVVSVMPSVVLGMGDSSSGLILRLFLEERLRFKVDHPGRVGWVHADDVADGAVAALAAGDGAYILDEVALTFPALLERLEGITGIKAPRRVVPYGLFRWSVGALEAAYHAAGRTPPLSTEVATSLGHDHVYDARRAREELGWRPDMDGRVRQELSVLKERAGRLARL